MGRRVLQALGLAAVLLFATAAFTPIPGALARRLAVASRPGPAQAIVVLGSGIYPDGLLDSESLRRALEGILLYRSHLAPLLVLLGPRHEGSPSEASVRAELARRLGVGADGILTLDDALTTRDEAGKVAALLGPRGVRRLLLVTDPQHLARAVPLFERVGFEVAPIAAENLSPSAEGPQAHLELAREVLMELVARAYYRLAGYL